MHLNGWEGFDVLGESPADEARHERARFMSWLGTMPCADATRSHDGYCRDQFRGLLDGGEPPNRFPWRRLIWSMWRCFTGIQAQRARLNSDAAVSAV